MSYESLIKKIDSAKPNKYGAKRIDYGTFDTIPGKINIWAGYSAKDSSYFICVNEVGKTYFNQFALVEKKYKNELSAKEKFEKILATINPKKWKSAW